ncbi:MAG: CvpA family protein [Candidatus Omnitrophica bacterium]|nr:CvpA family protein [Candidatus Omnitrophota bacterium]
MPHIRFNWVDILFVTLVIRICYIGYKKGLFSEQFRLLGLFTAFILSFNNYTRVSNFLTTHTSWSGIKPDAVSFLFIFLLILAIFKILTKMAGLFFGGEENVSIFNSLAGFVLALARGLLLIGLIYVLLVNSHFKYLSNSAEERSFSGQYVAEIAPFAYKAGMAMYPWKATETPLVKLINS